MSSMISVLISCLVMFLVIYFMVLSPNFDSMFDFIYCVIVDFFSFVCLILPPFPISPCFPTYYYSSLLKCAAMPQQKVQYFTFILNDKPSDSPIGTSVETSLLPERGLTFFAVVIHVSLQLPITCAGDTDAGQWHYVTQHHTVSTVMLIMWDSHPRSTDLQPLDARFIKHMQLNCY